MAKLKRSAINGKVGGPFLAASVFCESILDDKSGKISAVGIIDSANYFLGPDAPDNVPSDAQPVTIAQTALFVFRSGDSPGTHRLKVVVEAPDGKKTVVAQPEITLSNLPYGGANMKVQMAVTVRSGGLYWFDILLDGKRLTRMPLNVTFQRLPAPLGAEPMNNDREK